MNEQQIQANFSWIQELLSGWSGENQFSTEAASKVRVKLW